MSQPDVTLPTNPEAWMSAEAVMDRAMTIGVFSGPASMATHFLEPHEIEGRTLYLRGEVEEFFRQPPAHIKELLQREWLDNRPPVHPKPGSGNPSNTPGLHMPAQEASALLREAGVPAEKIATFLGTPHDHRGYRKEHVQKYAEKHGLSGAEASPVAASTPPSRKVGNSDPSWNVLRALWEAGGQIQMERAAAEAVLQRVRNFQPGATLSGVKQHLWKFENSGVVRVDRTKPKTPASGYELTPLGVEKVTERFGPLPEVQSSAPAAESEPEMSPEVGQTDPEAHDHLADVEEEPAPLAPRLTPVPSVPPAPTVSPRSVPADEDDVAEASLGSYTLDVQFIRAVMAMDPLDRKTLFHTIGVIEQHADSVTWSALPIGTRAHIILEMVRRRLNLAG